MPPAGTGTSPAWPPGPQSGRAEPRPSFCVPERPAEAGGTVPVGWVGRRVTGNPTGRRCDSRADQTTDWREPASLIGGNQGRPGPDGRYHQPTDRSQRGGVPSRWQIGARADASSRTAGSPIPSLTSTSVEVLGYSRGAVPMCGTSSAQVWEGWSTQVGQTEPRAWNGQSMHYNERAACMNFLFLHNVKTAVCCEQIRFLFY